MKNVKSHLLSLLKIEPFWVVTGAITLVLSLVLLASGHIVNTVGHLEFSWKLALHEFFAAKKQFGTEIIFTFGPYGFLYTKMYHPKTYWLTNLGWLLFSLVFWWSSFYISYKLIKHKAFVFLWFATLFFLFSNFNLPDSIFTYFYIFFLIHYFYIKDKQSWFNNNLLVFIIGLISLIKFSFFILAIPIIILVTLNDILQKRKPIEWITFVVTFLTLWLLAEQSLFFIPSYIKNSLEIAIFYNYSITPVFSPGLMELLGVVWFFLMFLVITCLINWRKCKQSFLFASFSFTYLVFITLKAGYGRFDFCHFIPSCNILCFITIFYLIFAFEEKVNNYIKVLIFSALILIVSLFQVHLYKSANDNSFIAIRENFKLLAVNIGRCWLTITNGINDQQQYEEQMEGLRAIFPLPLIEEETDLYTLSQSAVIAHSLNHKPRPIFQSYSAYSPALAKINADFLKNTQLKKIIFKNETIDQRYPTLDDSLSWLEFLAKYEIKSFSPRGDFLILEKSQKPSEYTFVSAKNLEISFNERIEVPRMNLGPVWLKATFEYSFWGKILATIYKPSPVRLIVTKIDGKQSIHFLPTPLAETGFLLSPLIDNNLDFAKLANQEWAMLLRQQEIESIAIVCEKDSLWQFIPKIKITFSQLNLQRQSMDDALFVNLFDQYLKNIASNKTVENSIELQEQNINTIIGCEKILEKNTSQTLAYNLIGLSLLNLHLIDEAIEIFQKAKDFSPNNQLSGNNLHSALLEKVGSANKIVSIEEKSNNYFLLGNAYMASNKIEKGSQMYEKAIGLTPANATIYNNLSAAYFQMSDWDKSINAAEIAIKLAPNFVAAKEILQQAKLKKMQSQKTKEN